MKFLVLFLMALTACVPTSNDGNSAIQEDGFFIRSFADGSASVSTSRSYLDDHWSIDCTKDAMTDRRECSISSKFGGPFIYYGSSAQPQTICILEHDFPGRTGMIRVDSNAPITTDTDGCVRASSILTQMLGGTKAITRRVHWPYDYPVDETYTLSGIGKAMEVVDRIRAGTMPITN